MQNSYKSNDEHGHEYGHGLNQEVTVYVDTGSEDVLGYPTRNMISVG